MESKRNDINELSKQKETHRLREWTYGCQGEGIVREFVVYTLLYLKWITNKDILYSTWNSVQCYVAAWMGGEFGGGWIHVYEWLSPFTVHLKPSQHVHRLYPNTKFFFFLFFLFIHFFLLYNIVLILPYINKSSKEK